ncbi:MAG: DNA translocase FtsK [Firmicutes bacterium]|nr:DNA translocase FtsK [Bacillota bacterium]
MGVKMGQTSNKKKNNRSGKKAAIPPRSEPFSSRTKEIIGVAVIALALLLLCCIVLAPEAVDDTNALGSVSLLLLELMRFLAGQAALSLPLGLLVYGALLLLFANQTQSGQKLSGLILFWVAFLGLFSLNQPILRFTDYMAKAFLGAGGGFIGGFGAYILQKAFGHAGSLIIFIALALIGFLLFMEKSLTDMLHSLFVVLRNFLQRLHSGSEQKPQNNRNKDATPVKPYLRQPLIIRHDDPAPLISECEESIATPPPYPNRFSTEFLPDIDLHMDKTGKNSEKKENSTKARPAKTKTGGDEEENHPVIAHNTDEQGLSAYCLPPLDLVESGAKVRNPHLNKAITDSIALLETTLGNFGVKATVTQVVAGPAVTRYELQPAPGIKVARIVSLADDIALALAATAVRIEAPIPGKSAIGIEVARNQVDIVYFREVLESAEFAASDSKLSFALGKNIGGEPIVGDLAKMPHLLIAGATGSGKSICVNSILCSVLYKAHPDEVKLMLIDPKKVEMAHYNKLPHLVAPVVTDNKKAANALKWVVNEMENRYSLFVDAAVKDFSAYNLAKTENPLPQILVVIDELADLMMVARHDVEDAICRIAQMARAAGIHLVVATQRPSVDVITGLIKANIPSRIAFAVSSYTDSRTILDMGGAEKLLGRGDMLYSPIGSNKPLRVQGSYIAEKDISKLVAYCTEQAAPRFLEAAVEAAFSERTPERIDELDELFYEAGALIIGAQQASTSFLQRRLSIGNPRAARIVDQLAERGVVGGPKGAKPRDILMTKEEFADIYGNSI